MPHYFNKNTEVNRHCREHYQGNYTENNQYIYCQLCCPTDLPVLPTVFGFQNFWNWIKNRYTARAYTGYTIAAFGRLEESINRGDLFLTDGIILSITFNRLLIPAEELSYYIRYLNVQTNNFIRSPLLFEETQAELTYRVTTPPPVNQQQPPQNNLPPPVNQPPPQQNNPPPANMALSRDEMRDLLVLAFGANPVPAIQGQAEPRNVGDIFNQLATAPRPAQRVIEVPLFYGNDDEDPNEWVTMFEQAHAANGWSADEARKMALAVGHLRDAARDWGQNAGLVQYNDQGHQNTSF